MLSGKDHQLVMDGAIKYEAFAASVDERRRMGVALALGVRELEVYRRAAEGTSWGRESTHVLNELLVRSWTSLEPGGKKTLMVVRDKIGPSRETVDSEASPKFTMAYWTANYLSDLFEAVRDCDYGYPKFFLGGAFSLLEMLSDDLSLSASALHGLVVAELRNQLEDFRIAKGEGDSTWIAALRDRTPQGELFGGYWYER